MLHNFVMFVFDVTMTSNFRMSYVNVIMHGSECHFEIEHWYASIEISHEYLDQIEKSFL